MFALFWIKGRNKFAWAVLLVAVAAIGLPLMPEQWWTRMDTINTYSSDVSAMGRINAWWTAFYLAEDRFFGGGFMSWMPSVFERYAPNPEDVHAAHSIYFQVMGEQGFGGLFLFLAIGASTWLTASRLIRAGQAHSTRRWAEDLGQMVHVSMIGYGVTGAFLQLGLLRPALQRDGHGCPCRPIRETRAGDRSGRRSDGLLPFRHDQCRRRPMALWVAGHERPAAGVRDAALARAVRAVLPWRGRKGGCRSRSFTACCLRRTRCFPAR
jgi:hypothetical protein